MYSKEEESASCVVKRGSAKVGIQPSENGVKSTKSNEQPAGKLAVLIESNVLSTENEMSTDPLTRAALMNQRRTVPTAEKATLITTSDQLEANRDENENNNIETVKNKERNLKQGKSAEPLSRSSEEIVKSITSIPEHGGIIHDTTIHPGKADSNNNFRNTEISSVQQLKDNNIKEKNVPASKLLKTGDSPTDESVHRASLHEQTIVVKDKTVQFKNIKTTDTNSETKTNKDAKKTAANAEKLESKERNATWTVFYIVAVLTLCYLPISALLLYLTFKKEPDATVLFVYVPIADTVALFNAVVNPFIYCYKNRKMRAAAKNVLQKAYGGQC
jgi:hypothetical protein